MTISLQEATERYELIDSPQFDIASGVSKEEMDEK